MLLVGGDGGETSVLPLQHGRKSMHHNQVLTNCALHLLCLSFHSLTSFLQDGIVAGTLVHTNSSRSSSVLLMLPVLLLALFVVAILLHAFCSPTPGEHSWEPSSSDTNSFPSVLLCCGDWVQTRNHSKHCKQTVVCCNHSIAGGKQSFWEEPAQLLTCTLLFFILVASSPPCQLQCHASFQFVVRHCDLFTMMTALSCWWLFLAHPCDVLLLFCSPSCCCQSQSDAWCSSC